MKDERTNAELQESIEANRQELSKIIKEKEKSNNSQELVATITTVNSFVVPVMTIVFILLGSLYFFGGDIINIADITFFRKS